MDKITIETLLGSFLFALAFILGPIVHKPGNIRRRSFVSFFAGASVAYIFVGLSPELESARNVFREGINHPESYLAYISIHLATMLGFIFFYGIDQFVIRLKSDEGSPRSEEKDKEITALWIHLGTFSAYAWLVSYLLVDSLEEGPIAIGIYAFAMFLHFFTVSHGLHKEYGSLYDRKGAWLLAAASLLGWGCGVLFDLPKPTVAVLLGLVAGGVIVNTLIGELPREKEGRFLPFIWGAFFYTGLLLLSK